MFRERYQLGTSKPRQISKEAIQGILTRAVKNSNVRGQKKMVDILSNWHMDLGRDLTLFWS